MFPPFDAARFRTESPVDVALEEMTPAHEAELKRVVEVSEIWRNPHTHVPTPGEVPNFISMALSDTLKGGTRAFVVRWATVVGGARESKIVGCTRFFHLNLKHRRVQIGGTWLTHSARRMGVNRAVKWILLKEAFEVMNLQRVEFALHPDNIESRKAMLRIGASFEGVLRQHLIIDNQPRDTAMYSVVRADWIAGLPR